MNEKERIFESIRNFHADINNQCECKGTHLCDTAWLLFQLKESWKELTDLYATANSDNEMVGKYMTDAEDASYNAKFYADMALRLEHENEELTKKVTESEYENWGLQEQYCLRDGDYQMALYRIKQLEDMNIELQKDKKRAEDAYYEVEDRVCQIIGKEVGMPWYKDDQKNFPGATEADGVCTGELIAEDMANLAVMDIQRLKKLNGTA